MKRYNHNIRKAIKNMQAQNEFMQNVERFKETDFYKKHVDKVFYCKEMPDIVYFASKTPYTKEEEDSCSILLGKDCILYDVSYLQKTKSGKYIVDLEEL